LFIRKSLTSGLHLSDAAWRVGPMRQCAAAAWPPCTAPMLQLKAAIRTAYRTSRQLPRSPAPARPRLPRPRRPSPDRLARAAIAPTVASPAPARQRPPHAPLSEDSTPRCPSASERVAAAAPPHEHIRPPCFSIAATTLPHEHIRHPCFPVAAPAPPHEHPRPLSFLVASHRRRALPG
jgi:hypothetical protein